MSDIVKGLHDRAIGHGGDALLTDAAGEIDRLRADLLTRDGQAQELQGEVARLRGLLIEYAENDGNPRWAADYRRRVREILGR